MKDKKGKTEQMTMETHHIRKVDRNREAKGTMVIQNNQKANGKMAAVNPCMAIITLNINGLNSPIKRYTMTVWIKKTKPNCMLPTGSSFRL